MRVSDPVWTTTVPVLSTAHLPDAESLGELERHPAFVNRVACYDLGAFVFVPVGLEAGDMPKWFKPIRDWFETRFEDEFWLRFDRDGDAVRALPIYDW